MLLTKTIKVVWNKQNKNYYISKGYKFTHYGDEFQVDVKKFPKYSKTKIKVQCDNCSEIFTTMLSNYLKCIKSDGKYFCNKCACKLYGNKNSIKTKLQNSKSFYQWCQENNHMDYIKLWDYELNQCNPQDISYATNTKYYFKCFKGLHKSELKNIYNITLNKSNLSCNQCNSFAQWCLDNQRHDLLNRWDYDLNQCSPYNIPFGTHSKYYFKCPKGLHKSELHNIKSFVNGNEGSLNCKACNSFAQWGINNLGADFLKKYWDYNKNKNIDPWEISSQTHCQIWIKCQKKDYHESYKTRCFQFVNGSRCPYCCNLKIHKLDSLGTLYPEVFKYWSEKNKKSPYEYSPYSNKEVWWKCPNKKHQDFIRTINSSNRYNFRCPECDYSKGEERIENYFKNINWNGYKQITYNQLPTKEKQNSKYISQYSFNKLLGIRGRPLSYDFYLPIYNLLIEYQGQQHEKFIKGFHRSKKDFKIQQEHDRRKRQYAKDHNIKLLEIWYWDYDNIEKILKQELFNEE